MPRKSSFLMGFESGASIYDSAKRRQMAAKQLQLQTRQQTLAEDAAEQRRGLLDMQIKQAQQKMAEFKRKADERVTSYQAISDIKDRLDALNPEKDPKWWQDPKNYRLGIEIIREGRAKVRDPEAKAELKLWRESGDIAEATRIAEEASEDKRSSAQHAARMALETDAQKTKEVEYFNGVNGTTLSIHDWPRIQGLKKVRDDALELAEKTGKIVVDSSTGAELPAGMLARMQEDLDRKVRIHEGLETEEDEQFERELKIRQRVAAEHAKTRIDLANRTAFAKFAEETGNVHWNFDDPADKKEALTLKSKKEYLEDFKLGGPRGIALMNGIKLAKNGGYDETSLASALGNLETIKAEIKKSGQVVTLTEAQSKALTYGTAMYSANQTLDALAAKGYKALSAKDRLALSLDKYVPGSFKGVSTDGQIYVSAMQEWRNSKLRKDSGAAITLTEIDEYTAQFFPRLGESGPSVRAKDLMRKKAYVAIKVGGGTPMKEMWIDAEKQLDAIGTALPGGAGPAPVVPPGAGSARYPGTATTPKVPAVAPQPAIGGARPVITGTQREINIQIKALNDSGELGPKEVVRFRNPATGMIEEVPREQPMQQVEPTPAPAAPEPERDMTQPQQVPGQEVEGSMVAEPSVLAEPVAGEVAKEEIETAPGEVIPPEGLGGENLPGPLRPGVPELETEAEPEMKLPPLPILPETGAKPEPEPKKGAGKKVKATKAQDVKSIADYLVNKVGADPEEAQADSEKILEAIENPGKYPKDYIKKAKAFLDEARKKFPGGK